MPRTILILPLLLTAISTLMLSCTREPDTLIVHNVNGYTLVGGGDVAGRGARLPRAVMLFLTYNENIFLVVII